MTDESEPLALQPYCEGDGLNQLADHLLRISPGPLTLDATGVTSLTTPYLQILLSADQTYRSNGGSLTLLNATAELRGILTLLGADTQPFVTEGIE